MSLPRNFRGHFERFLDSVDRRCFTDLGRRFRNRRLGIHRNDYTFRSDQLAFVHLPKTGGTSLNAILQEKGQDRFTGVFRHRPISKKCPPESFAYFTVMRNPVDRVWSFYQMSMRSLSRGGGPYGHVACNGLEFFIAHCWEMRNMACRYYSGKMLAEPNAQTAGMAWSNLMLFRDILDFDDLSEEASRFLERHQIPHRSFPHRNKHPYQAPEKNELDLIEKANSWDLEIYRRWRTSQ